MCHYRFHLSLTIFRLAWLHNFWIMRIFTFFTLGLLWYSLLSLSFIHSTHFLFPLTRMEFLNLSHPAAWRQPHSITWPTSCSLWLHPTLYTLCCMFYLFIYLTQLPDYLLPCIELSSISILPPDPACLKLCLIPWAGWSPCLVHVTFHLNLALPVIFFYLPDW